MDPAGGGGAGVPIKMEQMAPGNESWVAEPVHPLADPAVTVTLSPVDGT